MDRRRVRELVRAHARGATLNRVCLDGIRVNWESRDLVSALLWDNARGDVDKERWIAWMREHRELCWSAFFRSVPADIVQWACSTFAPWMRNDDELPEPFRAHLERTKA